MVYDQMKGSKAEYNIVTKSCAVLPVNIVRRFLAMKECGLQYIYIYIKKMKKKNAEIKELIMSSQGSGLS